MIASTSSGRTFGGLARYLVVGRSGVEVDRVDWAISRNLPTDDPELAARLMEATAGQSLKVQKPVYHVSLSFDPTDQVRRQQVEQVADRLLRALELQEHQALLVAHRDREHAHVHIVVNQVHPDTGRAWERWQDRPRIEKELRSMERELGLRQVPGRLYREIAIEPPERSLRTPGEHRALARSDGLADDEVVSLREASRLSGYSVEHLSRLVREDKVPTARANGSRGRILLRRADVPIKPAFRYIGDAETHDLASRLLGGKEGRNASP